MKNVDAPKEVSSQRKVAAKNIQNKGLKQTKQQKPNVSKKKRGKAKIPNAIVSSSKKIKLQRRTTSKQSNFPKYISGYGLRKKRLSLNFTQAKFATFFDVSASTISQWERKGRKKLTLRQQVLDVLYRIWHDS